MRILLVEDDLQLQQSLKAALQLKDYHVDVYTYYKEALRHTHKEIRIGDLIINTFNYKSTYSLYHHLS